MVLVVGDERTPHSLQLFKQTVLFDAIPQNMKTNGAQGLCSTLEGWAQPATQWF
jgi:hypothetical protein